MDELEPEGQLFQVSAEVRADGIAAIEQFQFEIMSRVTWQRPNPDERFVTSIKIWSMDNNTSSRPFVLYGSPKTLGKLGRPVHSTLLVRQRTQESRSGGTPRY